MASSKKKPPRSDFDFDAFLNSDQSGMQTAVRAMLYRDPEPSSGCNLIPGLKLGSGISLLPAANLTPDSSLIPDHPLPFPGEPDKRVTESERGDPAARPDTNLIPDLKLESGISLPPAANLTPDSSLIPDHPLPLAGEPDKKVTESERGDPAARPDTNLIPDLKLESGISLPPAANLTPDSSLIPDHPLPLAGEPDKKVTESERDNPAGRPGLNLIPGRPSLPAGVALKRSFPIRQMRLAQDAHSRAEQAVYQRLWETAKPFDHVSRLITIGFGEMGRLVGLSESNARINTRSLIAKLALEEYAGYDCERGTGRTYRIFTYQEILTRRKEAGLTRYQRRTLAVVFVDEHDQPIDLSRKAMPGLKLPGGGDSKLEGDPGPNLDPEAGPNLGAKPGINLGPSYREQLREQETSSSSVGLIVQALRDELGLADDEAARRIQRNCREKAADASEQEIAAFVRLEAQRLRANRRVKNPIGLLITQVPKNFEGESFRQFRQARQRQGREGPLDDPERYRAIVEDPQASEPEKRIALAVLAGGRSS